MMNSINSSKANEIIVQPRSRYSPKDYGIEPEGGIFDKRRINQKFENDSPIVNFFRDVCFTLLCPVAICCAVKKVHPMNDTIVSRCGIVSEILREPGPYCFNPLCTDFVDVYMGLNDIEIMDMSANDFHGNPLKVSAQFVYRVTDSVSATFKAANMKKYLRDQGESALRAVLAHYPYDDENVKTQCLRKHSEEFDQHLQDFFQNVVNFAGIKIQAFRLIAIGYDPKMEKLLLAKQEAQAEVTARSAIADGTAGIIQEMIGRMKTLGIHYSDQELRDIASNLMLIIINHGHTSLILNQGAPLQPQMYMSNIEPPHK